MKCIVCDRKIKAVRCENCDGTGDVTPALSWNRVSCPDCNGTGKFRFAFCYYCWKALRILESRRSIQ